ncbi:MAG: hypothetical protein AB1410_09665 [Acidobacteriota bacterium]
MGKIKPASDSRLRGKEIVKIDDGGRLKIPKRFLDIIREKFDDQVYITSVNGDCVWVYPMRRWQEIEERFRADMPFNTKARQFSQRTSYWGKPERIDSKGRILLPSDLRKIAKLDNEIIVIGNVDYLEIWNKEVMDQKILNEPFDENEMLEIIYRKD